MTKTKKCPICKKIKLLKMFYNDKKSVSGKSGRCKLCTLAIQKKYHMDNKQERNEKCKQYYQANKYKYVLYGIRKRCNDDTRHNYNRYGGRGIKCLITKEEIKEIWFRDKAYLMKKPSIDREDNDGNYTFENCRFIELRKNVQKSRMKTVYQYNKQNEFIKKWNAPIHAEKTLCIYSGHISQCAKHHRKTAGGFIWKYKNES